MGVSQSGGASHVGRLDRFHPPLHELAEPLEDLPPLWPQPQREVTMEQFLQDLSIGHEGLRMLRREQQDLDAGLVVD